MGRRSNYPILEHPRLYSVYNDMTGRCYKAIPGTSDYDRYRGRGIQVCYFWRRENDGWNHFAEWAYANGYNKDAPKGECTLERYNRDGDYSPDNCGWENSYVQANNKSNTVMVQYKGVEKPIQVWCRELNLDHAMVRYRLDTGWTVESAFETPSGYYIKKFNYNGSEYTITELAKLAGVNRATFFTRLESGWTVDEAVNTPVRRRK